MQQAVKSFLYREGWPFVISCGLVYLGFVIELIGISLTDGNLNPLIRPAPLFWQDIGRLGLDLSTIAPLLAVVALYIARTPVAYDSIPTNRKSLWWIVVTAVFLSFVEFYWTWNAHATWLRGFVG